MFPSNNRGLRHRGPTARGASAEDSDLWPMGTEGMCRARVKMTWGFVVFVSVLLSVVVFTFAFVVWFWFLYFFVESARVKNIVWLGLFAAFGTRLVDFPARTWTWMCLPCWHIWRGSAATGGDSLWYYGGICHAGALCKSCRDESLICSHVQSFAKAWPCSLAYWMFERVLSSYPSNNILLASYQTLDFCCPFRITFEFRDFFQTYDDVWWAIHNKSTNDPCTPPKPKHRTWKSPLLKGTSSSKKLHFGVQNLRFCGAVGNQIQPAGILVNLPHLERLAFAQSLFVWATGVKHWRPGKSTGCSGSQSTAWCGCIFFQFLAQLVYPLKWLICE